MSITIRKPVQAASHCTTGVPGYPAIDYFGSLGEDVHIGEPGVLARPHLIPWKPGFGGWTFDFFGTESQTWYWITHLAEEFPAHAGTYQAGDRIGYLVTDPNKGRLIGRPHVHAGNTAFVYAGHDCGVAIPPSQITQPFTGPGQVGDEDNPFPQLQGPLGQEALERESQLPGAWADFNKRLSRDLPRQLRRARNASARIRNVVR